MVTCQADTRDSTGCSGELTGRIVNRPGDQQERRRDAGHEHENHEIIEAPVHEDTEQETTPPHEIDAPHDGLDAEDALELLGLSERLGKRVPRTCEHASEGTTECGRAEERETPDRCYQHWLREVHRAAVSDQADDGLNDD